MFGGCLIYDKKFPPPSGQINVVPLQWQLCQIFGNIQLHAEYDRNNDVYLPHRVVQAYHLSKLIAQLTDPEDFVILCGDMNSEPVDPCYRIMKELPQLSDCWLERGAKVLAE